MIEPEFLAPGRPVVVMLSGGRDSVCLLDLAAHIAGAESARALHVNYGLRAGAGADEALCRELCARLGVELTVHRAGPPTPGNLQNWARDVRYTAAEVLADGCDIAVAHTASDQVETVLYRLAASPGRKALLGMRPRRGNVVRPLLSYTRAHTTAYCAEHGLRYSDDPTNATETYARNRVRHGLVEALRSVHPAAEANLLETLAILRDEALVLDRVIEDVLTDDLEAIAALEPALRRLVLERLAGSPVGRRTEEILALAPRGKLDLGAGVRAVVERGRVRFEPTPPLIAPGGTPVSTDP